uniref:Leucine-rich repeat-containing N-terminal plant-type domain-containing protein n=1 Tax=Cannabis sativa TaxID=3483 RepID=A0A803P7Z5_CANSA
MFLTLIVLLSHAQQPSCYDEERNALIHFNQSFKIDCDKVRSPYSDLILHPKTLSWGSNGTNCCSWEGVECDMLTGRVISLNLSSSCLYGSIHSNSTLFQLVYLQELDLHYNNFTFSPIPNAIGIFSELKILNLRSSFFQGQIPLEFSLLSKLSFLDLSYNVGGNDPLLVKLLKLKNPNLRSLVKNLTSLDTLFTNYVDIGYELGDVLANLTSLRVLGLGNCGLYGPIPSSLGKLTKLNALNLKENDFIGTIPSSIQNLTQLFFVRLPSNQISGPIPSWFGNLTKLTYMNFHFNHLSGSFPPSLFQLNRLETLSLQGNDLTGTLQLDSFLKLKNIMIIDLSHNKISLHVEETKKGSPNTTLSNLKYLSLASCNLSKFPEFIAHQTNLHLLDLAYNSLFGQIPQNLMNSSIHSLEGIYLSNNLITGFHNHTTILPWSSLHLLELQDNLFQGQLPIPPSSVIHYDVSNNILSGEIPSVICNLSSILVLDLSNNNLSGDFPLCSGNGISDSLLVLNLKNNSFHGTVPLQCQHESELRMADFSNNHFQGKLQRPFTTCMNLEYLDFSFNQLSDVFPTWLGSFPRLKVILMRENKFHGVIGKPQNSTSEFQMLQIIDMSHNYFIGPLPYEYMFSWNSMKAFKMSNLTYMKAWENITFNSNAIGQAVTGYDYSTTIVMKSVATHYGKIPINLAVIDLSSNNFSGQIPKIIGSLKALYSLNLSNNALSGHIPPSLGTLTELESLDLSQNQLSGKIPRQLVELKFLQMFDVSYNNLTGIIPQENQFHTFENNSFEGNQGLCGEPLSKKCEALLPPSAFNKDVASESAIELDWKFILAGLVSGFAIGVSLGEIVIPRTRLAWLVYISRTRLREMIIRN